MKDVQGGLGVKNMSDLVLQEIYGIYKTKSFTNKQIQKQKMNLAIKLKKTFMSKMMSSVLLLNVAQVKKKKRKKDRWIQKKINDSRT